MNRFEEVSDQKFHLGYQKKEDVFKHSVDQVTSKKLVQGYVDILKNVFDFYPHAHSFKGIDIGAGAGLITQHFVAQGFQMCALEKSEDALRVFKEFNPTIPLMDGDLRTFREPGVYDFIFSREVYLFTRVNSYSDQYRILTQLIDSLKENGILILIMSQRSWPHCADIKMINRYLKNEKKIKKLKIFSEIILKRIPFVRKSEWIYRCFEFLMLPVIFYFTRRGYANHLVLIYQK